MELRVCRGKISELVLVFILVAAYKLYGHVNKEIHYPKCMVFLFDGKVTAFVPWVNLWFWDSFSYGKELLSASRFQILDVDHVSSWWYKRLDLVLGEISDEMNLTRGSSRISISRLKVHIETISGYMICYAMMFLHNDFRNVIINIVTYTWIAKSLYFSFLLNAAFLF